MFSHGDPRQKSGLSAITAWLRTHTRRVKVHVYALSWNELPILPHFLAHYGPVAERFFICDDGSTDGSYELLSQRRDVVLTRFRCANRQSFVLSALDFYNHAWKQSRGNADWVIVCNVDELLYHPNLPLYLARMRASGVTALPAIGYQMISQTFPTPSLPLLDQVTRGMRHLAIDKTLIFNPDAIEEIDYEAGRHTAHPIGRVVYPVREEVKLLHFKYLGLDYLERRYRELDRRLGEHDVALGFGFEYRWSAEQLQAGFEHISQAAEMVL